MSPPFPPFWLEHLVQSSLVCVHPLGLEDPLKEKVTEQHDAEEETKQRMGRIHAKVHISPRFFFFFHPHSRQIFSCKAYSGNDGPPDSVPEPLTSKQIHSYHRAFPKLKMNEEQLKKKNLTLRHETWRETLTNESMSRGHMRF